jgi:lipopolysaccharide/colanic/teichoic acid biosynthesis glycosyltransferase
MKISSPQRSTLLKTESLISIVVLLSISPLLLTFALLIKLTSPGPILFRQTRVGRYGRFFTLFKLRTMSIAKKGPLVTGSDDARITWVGKLLRKTKIDELPTLWNVACGDMSIVGPRPEVPEFVDLDDVRWQEVLQTRPGITDPVTLRLRNEENLLAGVVDKQRFYREVLQPYKINGYLDYVRTKNRKSDLTILAQTLRAVILPHTAKAPTPDEMIALYSEG